MDSAKRAPLLLLGTVAVAVQVTMRFAVYLPAFVVAVYGLVFPFVQAVSSSMTPRSHTMHGIDQSDASLRAGCQLIFTPPYSIRSQSSLTY